MEFTGSNGRLNSTCHVIRHTDPYVIIIITEKGCNQFFPQLHIYKQTSTYDVALHCALFFA